MKTTLLSVLVAVTVSATANAQSTLTGANMNPVHGDVFYSHSVDTNVSKGASGAGVTWNFTTLTENAIDTAYYVACDSTPYCDSFAGSNIAETNSSGDYSYISTSATSYSFLGFYTGGMAFPNIDPHDLLHYPLSYGQNFADPSLQSFAPGFYHKQLDSSYYDAWGTLNLPGGVSYTNVARLHIVSYTTDSAVGYLEHSRTESYMWLKTGLHYPVFYIAYDTMGSASGAPYVSQVFYTLSKNPLSVKNVNEAHTKVYVFPNPATETVHIRFNLAEATAANVSITDVTGRRVATIESKLNNGTNDITCNTSELSAGLYIVTLQTATGSVSQQLTIAK